MSWPLFLLFKGPPNLSLLLEGQVRCLILACIMVFDLCGVVRSLLRTEYFAPAVRIFGIYFAEFCCCYCFALSVCS